jgi:hypothetical protein
VRELLLVFGSDVCGRARRGRRDEDQTGKVGRLPAGDDLGDLPAHRVHDEHDLLQPLASCNGVDIRGHLLERVRPADRGGCPPPALIVDDGVLATEVLDDLIPGTGGTAPVVQEYERRL